MVQADSPHALTLVRINQNQKIISDFRISHSILLKGVCVCGVSVV